MKLGLKELSPERALPETGGGRYCYYSWLHPSRDRLFKLYKIFGNMRNRSQGYIIRAGVISW
jgi:hypothetical protein